MELLGRLSLLLVSFLDFSWMVILADFYQFSAGSPLPAPTLSFSPQLSIFVQGEWVSLICSIPDVGRELWFTFHEKTIYGQSISLNREKKKNTLEIKTLYPEKNRIFACSYRERSSTKRWSQSPKSNWVMLYITELPPPPALSLDPQYPFYIQGERVTLTCALPKGRKATGYKFYKEQPGWVSEDLPRKETGPYEVLLVDKDTAWNYTCLYSMWLSGLEIWSQQSNLVSVAMRESPPPPTLSLNPYHPVYIQGEWITLTCSTPEGLEISGYTFSKEFQGQRSEHSKIKVPLEAFSVGEDTAGNYSCMYWTRLSGREVQSAWSSLISVTMAYPPPAPVLKVDPASRVVTEGAFLVFTCLANGNNTGRKFHFYKDGANISSTTEGSQGSKGEPGDASPDFTLSILKSKPHHNGEFACSYEEEMEGRWVSSSWSPMTILTVWTQESFASSLMGYLRWALRLLILMVPLIFYCSKRALPQD